MENKNLNGMEQNLPATPATEGTVVNTAPTTEDAGPDMSYLDGHMLAMMAEGGAAELRTNADEVNRLNVFPVPDGDTGDNMRMTIESGIAALENASSDSLAEIMTTLSHGMLLGARGNSGVILSQFFAGMAKGFQSFDRADAAVVANALDLGVKQAYSSVMTPTEGTILTVARESVDYAISNLTEESTIRSLFSDLLKEMRISLEHTPEILTVLKEAGVVDSGGAGLLYIMDGFNRVLNGEEVKSLSEGAPAPKTGTSVADFSSFGPDSVMEFGYCTEFLLQLQNAKVNIDTFDVDVIKDFLSEVGNSIVAFRTESIVKVHVHTMTPEKVLGFCRRFGEFLTVKIENMSVQHSEKDAEEAPKTQAEAKAAPEKIVPQKKYGIVVSCNGAGIEQLFTDIGTDVIVKGGQTNNPSTQDFLEAFREVPAEHIFVFPNNSNIVMAAKQAAEIYEFATVHVIENKDIGTGYVAISSADLSLDDPEAIIEGMKEAMTAVTTGFVSPSVRDAELNGIAIKKDDFIGFIGKEIIVSDANMENTAIALAKEMLTDEKFMLTVFFGKDATAENKALLQKDLAEKFPDKEIYYVEGEQDIYPYIYIAE